VAAVSSDLAQRWCGKVRRCARQPTVDQDHLLDLVGQGAGDAERHERHERPGRRSGQGAER
jgi:hypothetical protein